MASILCKMTFKYRYEAERNLIKKTLIEIKVQQPLTADDILPIAV